jgi:hypothetical protein
MEVTCPVCNLTFNPETLEILTPSQDSIEIDTGDYGPLAQAYDKAYDALAMVRHILEGMREQSEPTDADDSCNRIFDAQIALDDALEPFVSGMDWARDVRDGIWIEGNEI